MNIYEKDWDVLLILDACRVDTMQCVADEYEFLPDSIPHITSVGAGSPQWLANTFTADWGSEMARTTYISANPHTKRVLGASMEGLHAEIGGPEDRLQDFDTFVPVWETHWDDDLGTVPPRAVTDHLIDFQREHRSSRVIAHYMQPHFPAIPSRLGGGMIIEDEANWANDHTWNLIRKGEISVQEAYEAYTENLRYVLDDIELVLENTDAETVIISADHGNAFGEWGEFSHGHPYIGAVRNVPWIKTSASDQETHTPDVEALARDSDTPSVDAKLRALGYRP